MPQYTQQHQPPIDTSRGLAIVLAVVLAVGFAILVASAYFGW
jgi:hypothetical protein